MTQPISSHKTENAYQRFSDFYPFYLSEHSNRTCRRLHFVGSTLAIVCLVFALVWHRSLFIVAALLCGYGFAWAGHYLFEKNRPATFRHPIYSFMGDWVLYASILRGRIPF